MSSELQRLCDSILRRNLPAPVSARIRRLLESGYSASAILDLFREAGAVRTTLLGLAIEAETLAIAAEIKMRRN